MESRKKCGIRKCSVQNKMDSFPSDSFCTLFQTNHEVKKHNAKALMSVQNPVIRIVAKNSCNAVRKMPQEQCGGLTNDLYLCRRAFVMITHNLCLLMGLADGSTGFVVDIQFRDEDDPKTDLPYCIWVEIDAYSGESHSLSNKNAESGFLFCQK